MRGVWKSRMFYRYLLSYLLIFLFPLIALGYLMYGNAVASLRSEVKDSNLHKLEFVKDTLDGQIKTLGQTAAKIAFDPQLTSFAVKNGGYNSREAIARLQNYRDNSYILDDVMLYYRGDDSIYSATGLQSLYTLTHYIYKFSNWQEDAFYRDINTVAQATIRSAEVVSVNNNESRRELTYLFPIPVNALQPLGTVMFLVRESTLTEPIERLLGEYDGSIFVWDENRTLLASGSRNLALSDAARDRIVDTRYATGVYDLTLDRQSLSLATVTSADTGWTFSIVMPADQFMQRVVAVKTLILYALLAVLFVGVVLAALLSSNSYRPIRHLVEHVRKGWLKPGDSPRGNELDIIRHSVHEAFDMNANLRGQIDTQRPLVRKQTLHRLLRGEVRSREALDRELAALHMALDGPTYYVMVIAPDDSAGLQTVEANERLQLLLDEFACGGQIGYGVELIREHAYAMTMSAPVRAHDVRRQQDEAAARLRELCRDNALPLPTVAIGKGCDDPLQLHRSFVEACAALENRVRAGNGSVIFFEDVYARGDNKGWHSAEEQIKLVHGIKQGNRSVALEALERMLAEIKHTEQPLHLLKISCFDVINTVLRTMRELEMDDAPEAVRRAAGFGTIEELQAELGALVGVLCDRVERHKESKNSSLAEAMLRHTHEAYLSPEFSLEGLADALGLSAAYASRFFKDQTGLTFTDYVGGLRLTRIKRELIETDDPIKDIVVRCGYLDVPSLLRKFKKVEGITPGEYRRLHVLQLQREQNRT
ncbi:helix-turn-helix domain-containing protein [Paenibacillus cymbidii]|uniref:helix-turn-helix domain-containing protein n=1 Tax=Paenibacillus cymbidii TaxID=1639034 RepID=UPI001080ED10|nr:helix-turn-helix domain-containing protein [Paenibacillus cymbidii]